MQIGLIELQPRRLVPLAGWEALDRGVFRFNRNKGTSAGSNITVSLPVPHMEDFATYVALGGGGAAGQAVLAGNAPGGGGSGGLIAVTFRRPYDFDRVVAEIGYGALGGTSFTLRDGGDTTFTFYRRGIAILTIAGLAGKGSAQATKSVGGAGGLTTIADLRFTGARVPRIVYGLRPLDPVALVKIDGQKGEKGEARGNDIGGDGGDSVLSFFTKRYGDQVGGRGGLVNNDPASGVAGWGAGSGGGVGAGASGDAGGGVAGLVFGRPDMVSLA